MGVPAVQAAAHGIVGGLSQKLNGGSFSKGLLSSFVNKLATPSLVNIAGDNQALVIAGSGLIAGGVMSLAGGSFGEGALLGVMATVLNNYGAEIDYKKLATALLNAGAATLEVFAGLGGIITGVGVVPGSIAVAHGLTGLANSAIDTHDALNGTDTPGAGELIGGSVFGEAGESAGKAIDAVSTATGLGGSFKTLASQAPKALDVIRESLNVDDTLGDMSDEAKY